jgi:hypothetical protein
MKRLAKKELHVSSAWAQLSTIKVFLVENARVLDAFLPKRSVKLFRWFVKKFMNTALLNSEKCSRTT